MRGRRRRAVRGVAIGGLALVTLAILTTLRYYPAYGSALAARSDLRNAQQLLRERGLDASPGELRAAEAQLERAEREFRRAHGALSDPLAGAAQRLPLIGDSLDAGERLTEMGLEGVALGREVIVMARTFQSQRSQEEPPLTERTEEIVRALDPRMDAIDARLSSLEAQRRDLTGATLPSSLLRAVHQLDRDIAEMRELAVTYHDLSNFLPAFLGFRGPRTYLLLAQNNAELLPTGGLISVYGLISVDRGRIVDRQFDDAVSFGGRWLERTGAYVEPPAALKHHLLGDHSWNLAVSNWSPDFPTAAREAQRFFSLAGGRPVDGVIAINVDTIEELLGVTGPVAVESYGVTVTQENALDVIEEHTRTAADPASDRKAFVGLLAEELLTRLTQLPSGRWTDLLRALERMRDGRQILLFSEDEAVQQLARRLGIDGALESPASDYFMLVDASVSSTKLNVALEQRIELSVALDAGGNAAHTATVRYHNNLPGWAQGRDPALVHRLMLGGLYGGYTRVLAPFASRLERLALDAREVGPEEISRELGKTVFGRSFALPSGQTTALTFEYHTPSIVRRSGKKLAYALYVQKQPGSGPIPVLIRVELPEGARFEGATLDGEAQPDPGRIVSDLAEDRALIVRYRLED